MVELITDNLRYVKLEYFLLRHFDGSYPMLTLSLLLTCLVKETAIGTGFQEGSCFSILPFLFNFSLATAEVEGSVEAGGHLRPRVPFVVVG